ncbi:hypothetical protein [Nocardioides sp.]|uniref:hypothetical protein n=1 Tax=Nocardioides sp. TaxID=35761 RepID=UPI0027219182|nr:hypothetical protein [Nocardioides sp.]MDO9458140.1 hypothetical protein [Nocardioides sp.]
MTDQLNAVLRDQAETVRFAPVDLSAVTSDGDRTLRRRRRVAATAVVAVAVLAVGLGVAQLRPGRETTGVTPADRDDLFPTSTRDLEPMVTVGPRGFEGDRVVRYDHWVDSLVRTLDSHVYRYGDRIYADVGGTTTDLGPGDDPVGDEDGHLVGWVRATSDDLTAGDLVVLDTRTLGTRTFPLGTTGPGTAPTLVDLEGATAYVQDGRGSLALDLVTGATAPTYEDLWDVENGVVAAFDEVDLTVVAPGRTTRLTWAGNGILSPDGHYFATEDLFFDGGRLDPVGVLDTGTGRRARLDVAVAGPKGEDALVLPTGWLDDDTVAVAVIPMDDTHTETLLTCDLPAATCQVAVADVEALPGRSSMGRTYPGGGHL